MHPRMQLMKTPATRSDFEHRFHRLREMMREGRYGQRQGLSESILDVRHLPNGRLDFLSVDESARLLANTMLQFANFKFPVMSET